MNRTRKAAVKAITQIREKKKEEQEKGKKNSERTMAQGKLNG